MKTQLCEIKNKMLNIIMAQMDHLEEVNVCELGEAIDIIKDIAEAEYYCSVVQAMNNKDSIDITDINFYLDTLANDVHKMMSTMSPEEKIMMRDKFHELEMIL